MLKLTLKPALLAEEQKYWSVAASIAIVRPKLAPIPGII